MTSLRVIARKHLIVVFFVSVLVLISGYERVPGDEVTAATLQLPRDAVQTSEIVLGYRQGQAFASPELLVEDEPELYSSPEHLKLNQWALAGVWAITGNCARLESTIGQVTFRFRGRDLHLELGLANDRPPIRFQLLVDGHPPSAQPGVDVTADGHGTVTSRRSYYLVGQQLPAQDHTVEIEFLDDGVEAFAFTTE